MSNYDNGEYLDHILFEDEDIEDVEDLCKYCGDTRTIYTYCSVYCMYHDTVVVPKKQYILHKAFNC